ncbi:hypothetical protein chiPu_0022534 [Chiloscyllium punctatum]|uniref:Uncharacterized protein n=1 Tax=Chiloscyllium punctatum TaxID=137246 RepID=A0A401RK22_CHIPU|nr:hypothetical protein [Chiloscyllium punctatum]
MHLAASETTGRKGREGLVVSQAMADSHVVLDKSVRRESAQLPRHSHGRRLPYPPFQPDSQSHSGRSQQQH